MQGLQQPLPKKRERKDKDVHIADCAVLYKDPIFKFIRSMLTKHAVHVHAVIDMIAVYIMKWTIHMII